MEPTANTLTERDIEKLREIQRSILEGVACTYDKNKCLEYLESILNPKCCVCRKPLTDNICIVKGHKMHIACRKRYPG